MKSSLLSYSVNIKHLFNCLQWLKWWIYSLSIRWIITYLYISIKSRIRIPFIFIWAWFDLFSCCISCHCSLYWFSITHFGVKWGHTNPTWPKIQNPVLNHQHQSPKSNSLLEVEVKKLFRRRHYSLYIEPGCWKQ